MSLLYAISVPINAGMNYYWPALAYLPKNHILTGAEPVPARSRAGLAVPLFDRTPPRQERVNPMADKPDLADTTSASPAAPPTPAPRRSPGHRGQDVRDTVAEMALRAQEISQEAGSKMAAAMKDVVSAAAGLTAFAVESARDLVQYMVRRGQMTQEEADKLIREAEAAAGKRKPPASVEARPPRAEPVVRADVVARVARAEPPGAPAPKTAAKAPAQKTAARAPAQKTAARTPAQKTPARAPARKTAAKAPAQKTAAKAKGKVAPKGSAKKGARPPAAKKKTPAKAKAPTKAAKKKR